MLFSIPESDKPVVYGFSDVVLFILRVVAANGETFKDLAARAGGGDFLIKTGKSAALVGGKRNQLFAGEIVVFKHGI